MAAINFTQFDLRSPLLTSDYIVGYKEDGSAEFRSPVQDIVNLVQDSDNQTLSFNEASKDLTISSGNTVSLSALVLNTDFDSYKTDVASATGTLLPLAGGTLTGNLTVNGTVSASSTIFSADKQVVTTNTTTVPGTSAVTGILAVSALPVVQEAGVLYIVI